MDLDHKTYDFVLGTTKPTPRMFEVVEVTIEPNQVVGNFSRALINEASRKNPLAFNNVNLTVEEIRSYIDYLMAKRIETVNEQCHDFRKLKILWIPSFVQHCMRLIGRVSIYEEGLELVPVWKGPDIISFDEAATISDKLGAFRNDLQMVQDAMPRDTRGNEDVMSTALIANYVCARKEVHIAATYVCAFMGMQLQKEAAFQVLYRMQYDDLDYIAVALTTQGIL